MLPVHNHPLHRKTRRLQRTRTERPIAWYQAKITNCRQAEFRNTESNEAVPAFHIYTPAPLHPITSSTLVTSVTWLSPQNQ